MWDRIPRFSNLQCVSGILLVNFKQKFRQGMHVYYVGNPVTCNIWVFQDPSITHTQVEYMNFPRLPLQSFKKRQIVSIPYSHYYI